LDNFNRETDKSGSRGFIQRHPVLANILIILAVAIIGVLIVYFSIAIFTKHGQSDIVPRVENISYSDAIEKLHDAGLRYEIRDSIYREDLRPGYVIEQFPKPGAIVKPGRKVFLYINTVSPKQVVIDDDNHPAEYALKNFSVRQAMAKLEELGFKKIRIVRILGDNELVAKVIANGMAVRKTQKVPVNANIVLEVFDGRLSMLRDSLQSLEYSNLTVPEESFTEEQQYAEPSSEPTEQPEQEEPEFLE